MRWESNKIAEDLRKLPGVKSVKVIGQGGDYDSENLLIKVEKGDPLWVCGYPDNAVAWEPCKSPGDTEVMFVELKDGLDSRGGLNSKKKATAQVYIEIRQYFLGRGADVINTYEEVY